MTETIDRAQAEYVEAKKAAKESRRAFRAELIVSAFVRLMRRAMDLYRQARGEGVSQEDAIKGLEEELRGAWPKSVSKFTPVCDACDDTGWREKTCWEQQRCGRQVCAMNPERTHLYVVPCDCVKGDLFRPKLRTSGDAIAAAGKTRKPRGFRPVGS